MGAQIRQRSYEENTQILILPLSSQSLSSSKRSGGPAAPLPGSTSTQERVSLREPRSKSVESSNTVSGSFDVLWEYTGILYCSLALWFVYLVLPKGLRKAYCRAGRKRYRKRGATGDGKSSSSAAYAASLQSNLTEDSLFLDENAEETTGTNHEKKTLSYVGSTKSKTLPTRPYKDALPITPSSVTASASHPAVDRIPEAKILNQTMYRLKEKGVRLVAHGVQSEPKRVWIRYEQGDDHYLCWQAEYPKIIQDQNGESSSVLMRGSDHRIPVANILYIDVGKKTAALHRTSAGVSDSVCFSLLTQSGSLDLQTNSKLERDALVCSLSFVLDQVHTQNWRRLHDESPAPSEYMSSVNMSRISRISSNAFGEV